MDRYHELLDAMVKRVFGPTAKLAWMFGSHENHGALSIIVGIRVLGAGRTFAAALQEAERTAAAAAAGVERPLPITASAPDAERPAAGAATAPWSPADTSYVRAALADCGLDHADRFVRVACHRGLTPGQVSKQSRLTTRTKVCSRTLAPWRISSASDVGP